MKSHVNIPVFIPHLGCPNQCVFCNQRHISGVESFSAEAVIPTIESALETIPLGVDTEIAFFGGSFTGIDRTLMIELLEIANRYIRSGRVNSIRCSTRPDYISEDILDILERYNVKTVELGLQTVSEKVLSGCKRGHTFCDEENACRLIVSRGFELVGQMMIGLPGANAESEIETARFIAGSGARGARIYPTVVFRDTELCSMAESGVYKPLAINEAVQRSIGPLRVLLDAGLDVIRIGLCSSENLASEETYYAGPNHPALGEMIISRLFYDNASRLLASGDFEKRAPTVLVARGALSKMIGHKKENKLRLIREFGLTDIRFKESDSLSKYELKLVCEGDTQCI